MLDAEAIINVTPLDPNDLQSPILRQLHEICKRWQGTNPMLVRRDLKPMLIPACLPHIALVDYFPTDGRQFRLALTGEEIRNDKLGYRRGFFIEDVNPDYYRDCLLEHYRSVIQTCKAAVEKVVWDFKGNILPLERLIVPMSTEPGGLVTGLLVATHRGSKTIQYMNVQRDFELEEGAG